MNANVFENKTLLITGGTGSFGHAVLRRFLRSDIREIRIFSRDEKKQDDMRKLHSDQKLKFYLGDVRDPSSLEKAIKGVDFVFHAAALKQVPSCEFHPMEAVRTNVLGTDNVLSAAIHAGVKRVICLSTDKAVYPINAMGMTKAVMEKVMVAASRNLGEECVINGTRYGNVMASRGSVIPLFVEQLASGKPITITDPSMTRFMMTLEDAVELVLFAFTHGNNGDIFVQKSPAATIEVLCKALLELFEKPDHPVHIIGARHGEKLYETLLSREERAASVEMDGYFKIKPDSRDLNYGTFVDRGDVQQTIALHGEEYNSHNTERLNVEQTKALLMQLDYIKNAFAGMSSARLGLLK
jgi:UDP-N-acetylglucosamine 4,6-dehydratase/5-epimerase